MAQLMGTRPGEDLDVGNTIGIVFTGGLMAMARRCDDEATDSK